MFARKMGNCMQLLHRVAQYSHWNVLPGSEVKILEARSLRLQSCQLFDDAVLAVVSWLVGISPSPPMRFSLDIQKKT